MSYKEPAISRNGVLFEQSHALRDARNIIWERGEQVIIKLYEEGTIGRDKIGSINQKLTPSNILTYYAFPVIFNPTEKQFMDAGIKEKTQLIIWTSMWDWNNSGFTMNRLNNINLIKNTIIYRNSKYELIDKNFKGQFGNDTFLYITIGLNRK